MVLSCQNIRKSFGIEAILDEISFHIEDREKISIVGMNGAGKTTLLRIIIGTLAPDSGQVVIGKGLSLGYLSQHESFGSGQTIYNALLEAKQDLVALEANIRNMERQMKELEGKALTDMLANYTRATEQFERADGYAYKSQIVGVLKGLGFEDDEFNKPANTLSGGQKTRVALGRLLLDAPDILLLDEPTNHLDLNSIAWLETFLVNYSGSVILVSHDRYFLNKIASKTIEIANGTATVYHGSYSYYAEKKEQLREEQYKQYLNQQKEMKRQEEVIRKLKSFNREKSIKRAESREKMLSKIEVLDKPLEERTEMRFSLNPDTVSGNDVLTVEHLSKSFPSLPLFEDLNFTIHREEKVAIIGNNGTGKTTLLKIINGLINADAGAFTLGAKVKIGYYDQDHQLLHHNKTLFEELADSFPKLTETKIRNVLAAFLFTGDDVYKQISNLSGGERGRLSLAKLMLSECNFLILDEPTNHLDIVSKEILEQALTQYTGTVLYVSHDRYFINQTANRILDLTGQTLVDYIGNYDYYLEKKEELTAIYAPKSQDNTTDSSSDKQTKMEWKQQKEEQARQRKREKDLMRTEAEINTLEERDREIDQELIKEEVYTDPVKCMELNKEKTENLKRLEELYLIWEELESMETE